jgi:glycerol-3-phosphate O-acyltransferase/dihydroxyacetone phosphate acyltransferase
MIPLHLLDDEPFGILPDSRGHGSALMCLTPCRLHDPRSPVKIVATALGIPPRWFAYPALVVLGHLFLTHTQEIFYEGVRTFFRSILSIFFRSVDIVGIDNIPKHGPMIFSGNHSNQFVDGAMVLTTAQHRVGFLIAEKSYNHPVVGLFARLAGAVPVKRPQDSAKALRGSITLRGREVKGEGTTFAKDIRPGDKIRFKGCADGLPVAEVLSDTHMRLAEGGGALPGDVGPVGYERMAKVCGWPVGVIVLACRCVGAWLLRTCGPGG